MSGGFEDLSLLPELVRATQEMGWVLPSDVQDESIPLILGGGDVMVAAETGSGKTGAFALPAIQIVHETRRAAVAAAAAGMKAAGSGAGRGPDGQSAAKRARVEIEPVKLNTNDRAAMLAVSPDGLVCQCRQEKEWAGVRATAGVLAGPGAKVYYEARANDEGVCRFGWSSMAGSLDLGTDRNGYGFGATGKKSNSAKFDPYGEPFGKGDVIGCFLDLSGGADGSAPSTVSFSKNGKSLGVAFSLPKHAAAGPLYPAICMRNAEVSVSFAGPFAHPPPASEGWQTIESLPLSLLVRASSSSASSSSSSSSSGAAAGAGGKGAGGGGGGGGGGGKKGSSAGEAVGPVCIILEPARDLAEQTYKAIESMRRYVSSPEVTQACFIGGVDSKEISRQLQGGRVPDIITATPGKLLDLVEGRDARINLSQVRLLVLDEADRFGSDEEAFKMVSKLFNKIKQAIEGDLTTGGDEAAAAASAMGRLQVCFFSATLHSPEVTKLSDLMCKHPTWVDLKGKDTVPETVHHLVIPVDPSADRSWALGTGSGKQNNGISASSPSVSSDSLMRFVTDGVHASDPITARGSQPSSTTSRGGEPSLTQEEASEGIKRLKQRMLVSLIDSLKMEQCLIFCRTNVDCDSLEAYLTAVGGGQKWRPGMEKGKENPYSCVVLAGMRSMDERRRNLEAFKSGDVRFLICTDVAARGLDVKELPYVVNMTLPDETENYIHRIGRAGRAGRMGLAISLVSTKAQEKVWYHTCANRGKGCTNTKLKQNGGCCIWYDEPLLLRSVQKRLGMDPSQGSDEQHKGIPLMPVAFNAKPAPGDALSSMSLTSPKGAAGAGAGAGAGGSSSGSSAKPLPYLFSLPPEYADVAYGEERGDRSAGPSAHVEAIKDKVEVLSALEVKAQDIWLSLQRFNGVMAGAAAGKGKGAGAGGASASAGKAK